MKYYNSYSSSSKGGGSGVLLVVIVILFIGVVVSNIVLVSRLIKVNRGVEGVVNYYSSVISLEYDGRVDAELISKLWYDRDRDYIFSIILESSRFRSNYRYYDVSGWIPFPRGYSSGLEYIRSLRGRYSGRDFFRMYCRGCGFSWKWVRMYSNYVILSRR